MINMTTDTQTTLREIEERANKATDGPWSVGNVSACDYGSGIIMHKITVHVGAPENRGNTIATVHLGGIGATDIKEDAVQSNAEFIAAARTDIPFLLQLIAELRAENEKMKRLFSSACESVAEEAKGRGII